MPRRRGPRPRGPVPEIADLISQHLYQDADAIVQGLRGDVQPIDSIPVNRQTNRDYIKNGWMDPQFRMDLLNRIGPEEFLKQSHDAFGVPMPTEDKFAEAFGIDPPKLPKITVPPPPDNLLDELDEEAFLTEEPLTE